MSPKQLLVDTVSGRRGKLFLSLIFLKVVSDMSEMSASVSKLNLNTAPDFKQHDRTATLSNDAIATFMYVLPYVCWHL